MSSEEPSHEELMQKLPESLLKGSAGEILRVGFADICIVPFTPKCAEELRKGGSMWLIEEFPCLSRAECFESPTATVCNDGSPAGQGLQWDETEILFPWENRCFCMGIEVLERRERLEAEEEDLWTCQSLETSTVRSFSHDHEPHPRLLTGLDREVDALVVRER
jgi:hypothetical protein